MHADDLDVSLNRGRWLILRCQGCHVWYRFHDDDLSEHRILDELATFVPKHMECGGQIDVSVLPAQRHAPSAAHPAAEATPAE